MVGKPQLEQEQKAAAAFPGVTPAGQENAKTPENTAAKPDAETSLKEAAQKTAEAEKAEREKKERDAKIAAEIEAARKLEQEQKKSPDDGVAYMKMLWNGLDPDFERDLAHSHAQKLANGIHLKFADGHSIAWLKTEKGEFIAADLPPGKAFDADDARHVILASKSHGWKSIDLHGTEAQKELLWLEAKKAGLEVTNFEPNPQSKVVADWAKLKDKAPQQEQKEVPGTTPSIEPPAVETESKFEKFLTEKIAKTPDAQEAAGLKSIRDYIHAGQAKLNAEEQSTFMKLLEKPVYNMKTQELKESAYSRASKFFVEKTKLDVPATAEKSALAAVKNEAAAAEVKQAAKPQTLTM